MNSIQSTLMAFFDYNSINEKSCHYLYQEFLGHYVFLQKKCQWKPKQWGFAIGHMYYCNSFVEERYYLRLLLIIIQGAQSFQHLCIVDRILHLTFQATYITWGLLENDWK